eukprot:6412058-Amphidinium_carterae.1
MLHLRFFIVRCKSEFIVRRAVAILAQGYLPPLNHMSLPLLLKPARPVSYIVVEVEKPSRPSLHALVFKGQYKL